MIQKSRQLSLSSLVPKLQNQGQHCWSECKEVEGLCPFCGSEGLCCRKGWQRNECDGTIGGSSGHYCVARPSKIYVLCKTTQVLFDKKC